MKKFLMFSLAVGFVSLVISLLGGEFIVRHLSPQPTYEQSLKEGLSIFTASDIVPFTVAPNQDSVHLGYTREFNHKVATDKFGFRGKREISRGKSDGVFRILAVGDSMTFGWGVEDNETFAAVLERNLNAAAATTGADKKFEVINAGFMGGFTLDGFYSWLMNEGFSFKPDLVMVSFFPYNDISDLLEMEWEKTDESGLPVAVMSLDTTVKRGRLAKRHPTEWKYAIPVLRNSHLFMMLGSALEKYSPQAVEFIKKPLGVAPDKPRASREEIDRCLYGGECSQQLSGAKEKIWRLFEGMKSKLGQQGVDMKVIILAPPDQVKELINLEAEEKSKRLSSAQPQLEIRTRLSQMGIAEIDLLPELTDRSGEQYFYGRDGHMNVRGHGRTAEAIFKSEINLTDEQFQDLIERGILKF